MIDFFYFHIPTQNDRYIQKLKNTYFIKITNKTSIFRKMSNGETPSLGIQMDTYFSSFEQKMVEAMDCVLKEISSTIAEKMKERYPMYANDLHTLGRIFMQWHKKDFKDDLLPVRMMNESETYEEFRKSARNPVEVGGVQFRLKFGEDRRWAASDWKGAKNIYQYVLNALKGEPSDAFVAASTAWQEFKNDESGKPGRYVIGGRACGKEQYEKMRPHLGLLYLTDGIVSSEPSLPSPSKGLSNKKIKK